jgi:hypothetical protein
LVILVLRICFSEVELFQTSPERQDFFSLTFGID